MPVRHLALNLLTGLSLLLFVAGCTLWARSYFVQDVLLFASPDGRTTSVVHSTAGSFVLMGHQGITFPTAGDHFTEEVSVFVDGAGSLVTFIHHYDRDFGLSGVVFPQWVATAPFALLPAARLALRLRRRRSAARGFPVDAATPTA